MEMAESIERGVCLNCGLIITSEYFAEKKCPCCCNSNIKFIYQTIKEIDKQNKRIEKIGRKKYIYDEYNAEIDISLQNKVKQFYNKLNKGIVYSDYNVEIINESLQDITMREMEEMVERGICLNCGLITTSEYFVNKKCPCCNSDNIEIIDQTYKERDEQNKEVSRLGYEKYFYKEYGVKIDMSFQQKQRDFYAEINRKSQIEFEKRQEEINRNARKPDDPRKRGLVECPYCKSRDTEKISSLSRAVSVGFFGLGSKKIGKQWHCNRCKSDF